MKKNNSKLVLSAIFVILSIIVAAFSIDKVDFSSVFTTLSNFEDLKQQNDWAVSVNFLDVGKADCSYIRYKDANILIDSGDKDTPQNVVEYLKKQDVGTINLIIATHPHRDHIGQMYSVIDNFDVGCFMMPELPKNLIPTSFTFRKMLQSLKNKQVEVRYALPGQSFQVYELKIEILGPLRKYQNMNDNSVITKITYGGDSFLFMGDAEKASETDLVNSKTNLKCDVLKVGHHGSKTSTSDIFVKSAKPKYAVISSKFKDGKDVPHEIIERLNKFHVKILRTDQNGTITFLTNGNGVKLMTEKEMV